MQNGGGIRMEGSESHAFNVCRAEAQGGLLPNSFQGSCFQLMRMKMALARNAFHIP